MAAGRGFEPRLPEPGSRRNLDLTRYFFKPGTKSPVGQWSTPSPKQARLTRGRRFSGAPDGDGNAADGVLGTSRLEFEPNIHRAAKSRGGRQEVQVGHAFEDFRRAYTLHRCIGSHRSRPNLLPWSLSATSLSGRSVHHRSVLRANS